MYYIPSSSSAVDDKVESLWTVGSCLKNRRFWKKSPTVEDMSSTAGRFTMSESTIK